MKEDAALYLNQIYVTNLNEQKTVLSNYNGEFNINVKVGDIVRFTSIITERKDIKITEDLLSKNLNIIELKPGYHDIKEVVIAWKPSGNFRKDVLSLKPDDKKMAVSKMIGLPQPKGDGLPPVLPVASFQGGGLSFNIESIYDILSGERKKKERLYEYERMNNSVSKIRGYFGDDYFIKLKIPKNMINNFLQFVYSSDNIIALIDAKNIEQTTHYIEKYLPIYQKRLRNSNLTQVADGTL